MRIHNRVKKNKDLEQLEYNRKRWRTRRRMAISSFVTITAIVGYYVISPFFLSEEQAAILAQFNSIIITQIAFFSSLIMLYVGAATYEDAKNKPDFETIVQDQLEEAIDHGNE